MLAMSSSSAILTVMEHYGGFSGDALANGAAEAVIYSEHCNGRDLHCFRRVSTKPCSQTASND